METLLAAFAAASVVCPHPERIDFKIADTIARSRPAFTQGLVYRAGALFESAGGYGRSELNSIDPRSGEVTRRARLPARVFAEGLDFSNGVFIQLTWRDKEAYLWDEDLRGDPRVLPYPREGWGVTHSGSNWIVSDGTDMLRTLSMQDLSESRAVAVRKGSDPVRGLNELEWIDGRVFANVYPTPEIVRIHPESGCVDGVLDLSSLLPDDLVASESVANGIAYDALSGSVFVTGKNWPVFFELKLVPARLPAHSG